MKGIIYKSKEGWVVKYTTYKTIPGKKGVMGSHSRMPESNHIPIHPDNILYLCPGDNGQTIDFEIVEVISPVEDGTTMFKCAKLINEEKSTKRSKQKKHINIMEHNDVEKLFNREKTCTQSIVDEAMRITSKDVRAPKCVRDGIVKRMYTEEDIRNAIEVGINAEAGYYPKGFTHKLGISLEDYFINSLNKQE